MKKTIFYFILFSICFACSRQSKESELKEIFSNTEAFDQKEIQDTLNIDSLATYFEKKGSIIKIKNPLENNTGFYVYFTFSKGKAKNLMFYIQYEDRTLYQFSVNGEKYTYKTLKSKGRKEKKIAWYDYPIKTMDIKLFRSIINTDSSRIIFSDGTSILIDAKSKDALKKTLDYYELLGGTFPPYLEIE